MPNITVKIPPNVTLTDLVVSKKEQRLFLVKYEYCDTQVVSYLVDLKGEITPQSGQKKITAVALFSATNANDIVRHETWVRLQEMLPANASLLQFEVIDPIARDPEKMVGYVQNGIKIKPIRISQCAAYCQKCTKNHGLCIGEHCHRGEKHLCSVCLDKADSQSAEVKS